MILKDHDSHHVSIAHCQCSASVQCSPSYLSCHQPPYNLDILYKRHPRTQIQIDTNKIIDNHKRVVLVRLGEQFILVFSSHEAL